MLTSLLVNIIFWYIVEVCHSGSESISTSTTSRSDLVNNLTQCCYQEALKRNPDGSVSSLHNDRPPLPYLPDAYQVSVECNILDKGYTGVAKIYYDFPGNRATMKYFANGIERSLIFSYPTNEIFTVYSGHCLVSNLTASNLTAFFGETFSNGIPHIDAVQDSLEYGRTLGEVYLGNNDTVRGIPVSHWQACSNFSRSSTLVIDYYFSVKWSTASTFMSVPVRTEVKGWSTYSNGSAYLLHHIYDYFDFVPEIAVDDTIFQTPKGVMCPGRKSSKDLPTLPTNFNYRVEKVFTDLSAVVFEDVWYDAKFKFYRHDYRPLTPEYPLNTNYPVTEVHDYNTGVRYVMDQFTKDCKIVPLTNLSMDAIQNITARKVNGSFLLDMRNPLQLFNLDWNYTYIGQTYTRNILCDVYMARRHDLYIDGFVSYSNLTITFYFLSGEWTDVADHMVESIGDANGKIGIPIQMDLLADDVALSMSYNFLDFNPEHPNFDVFDISQCYPEAKKLTFQVTFQGVLAAGERETLQEWSHLVFAHTMEVSPIRISGLKIDNDDASIFITTTLLDKTLPTAEFTFFPNKTREQKDREVIHNTLSAIECAQFCVENPTFRCQSFDYCEDKTCRLSDGSTSSGQTLISSTICSHFARTVKALPPENSLFDAYSQLRLSVYNRTLQLSPFIDKSYTAVDVKVVFGWLNPRVVLPKLPNQFSYKVQVTVPATKYVYSSDVWYDDGFKLMRYDTHYRRSMYPFFTTNPLSVIEDYNTGIKYVIDKVYQNCTVSQLTADDDSLFLTPNTTQNATWEVLMKDPFSSFRIDSTYKFVGQQTVRGMTCNLFESLRSDFRLPNTDNHPVQSVFRYAFLSDQWSEVSDDYLGSAGQPIRLDITVLDQSFYIQYNFYDFDTDHPDIDVYDIHQCNQEGKWKHFTVKFPGPFHPFVDTSSRMFLLEGLFRMSNIANASILRFQRMRLDYDVQNIYLSASLSDRQTPSLYFTKIPVSYVPEHADKVLTISEEDQCADACLQETTIKCNSFYFCHGTSQCLLSDKHVPIGPSVLIVNDCFSYSRTVDNHGNPISSANAYILLKNSIYTGNFTINIPIPGTDQAKTYIASGVEEQLSAKETALMDFMLISNCSSFKQQDSGKILTRIAIDECALACSKETSFNCNAFSYSLDTQTCSIVPTIIVGSKQILFNLSASNYLYSKKYSKMYTMSPGISSQAQADSVELSVTSDDSCGRLCLLSTSFTCRLFQYCNNTQQCLLFKERTLVPTVQPVTEPMSICYQYTSKFINDFEAINAGEYLFINVLKKQMISLPVCADTCIGELGNNCKGFYYSEDTMTCYLTDAMPDDNSGRVQTKLSQDISHCDIYRRIYFPDFLSHNASTKSSISPRSPCSQIPSLSTASVKRQITETVSSITSRRQSIQASSGSSVTSEAPVEPTEVKQTGSCSSGEKLGLVVGIAFLTFAIGIIVGITILHAYRRLRSTDNMQTNIIYHDEIELTRS